ncbi:class I SAM-dependent methyltransferase [Shewanella colwelliana]|uniref:class I SAM-dependent methyltransferase n=1 Tax=Shewanella colwelliana TaxID=23 RepID=UPI00048F5D0B|nr:class I SAM-dependent methyltransferase [Shewanella colwelliana]MDX1281367.1 class I SAM-dependent methyltransferase [Shewanella colwelliana]
MDYLALNKTAWDERAKIHLASKFYDVPGFIAGNTSLQEIELEALDVQGKSLLHLQCHFGLDTLSWSRLGANVTGVDLSSTAIEQARALARQCQLQADFICSDIYQAPAQLTQQFDIIYTSYGVLCWLPDLQRWADIIAAALKTGGQFYMAEFHPVQALMEGYSYFAQAEPDVEQEATYTENSSSKKHTMVTWPHSLADVVTALLNAGLEITALKEFDFSPYDAFEGLVEGQTSSERPRYYLVHQGQNVPLVYTVSAIKNR